MPFSSLPQLPSLPPNANVGIFGGSFDPPHTAHQLLALSFLALESIDELWIIPCANHAFKDSLTDFSHRQAMCEIAFGRLYNTRVLDIENHLATPSYTIETLNFIRARMPSVTIHLAIGSDIVPNFSRWHKAEEIMRNARIVIFERDSYPVTTLPSILSTARMHHGYALPDINSTRLRDFLRATSPADIPQYVDRGVAQYILDHGLYR